MSSSIENCVKDEPTNLSLNVLIEFTTDGLPDSARFEAEKALELAPTIFTKTHSDCPVCSTTLSIDLKIFDSRQKCETVFYKLLEPMIEGLKDENDAYQEPKIEGPIETSLVTKTTDIILENNELNSDDCIDDSSDDKTDKMANVKVFRNRCILCLESFKKKSDLKNHKKNHSLACKICENKTKFTSKTFLANHMKRFHFDMRNFKGYKVCSRCGCAKQEKYFQKHLESCLQKEQDELETSIASGHNTKPPLQHTKSYHCSLCFKIFFNFQELTLHNKDHPLTCKFCNPPKLYNAIASLHTHVSEHHSHLRPLTDSSITCPICSRHFDEKVFRKHKEYCERLLAASKPQIDGESIVTAKLKPACPICGKQLARLKHVKKHIDVVHKNLRNYTCQYCGKSFAQKLAFTEHVTALHENPEPLICNFCGKKFMLKRQMEKHMKAMQIIWNLPRHPCDECTKTFKRYQDLIKHKRYHADDLPFRCQYCQKGYNDRSLLQRHEMMHRDERPFCCTYCDQRFRQKVGLISHIRLHTGEKSYHCSICQHRFHDRGCYRSHLIKHEKELGVVLDKSVKKFFVINPDI